MSVQFGKGDYVVLIGGNATKAPLIPSRYVYKLNDNALPKYMSIESDINGNPQVWVCPHNDLQYRKATDGEVAMYNTNKKPTPALLAGTWYYNSNYELLTYYTGSSTTTPFGIFNCPDKCVMDYNINMHVVGGWEFADSGRVADSLVACASMHYKLPKSMFGANGQGNVYIKDTNESVFDIGYMKWMPKNEVIAKVTNDVFDVERLKKQKKHLEETYEWLKQTGTRMNYAYVEQPSVADAVTASAYALTSDIFNTRIEKPNPRTDAVKPFERNIKHKVRTPRKNNLA